MKVKVGTISVHLVGWILLLMVPILSTHQVLRSFEPETEQFSFVPIIIMSLTLISIFYLNYFVLIPRFLLKRRYALYVLFFLMSVGAALLLSSLIFHLIDFEPQKIEAMNPSLAKVAPIARANAILLLIAAIVTSISLVLSNRLKQLEREKLSAQISSLKSQINPHFLFNTLNNIYASAIDTSPQTADMIEKLSGMMRYTMRETPKDFVDLEDEINYLNSFIELQKSRLENSVKLSFKVSGEYTGQKIAPMLLMPFIENAFKHGVNAEQESNIEIRIEMGDSEIHLWATNLIVRLQYEASEKSGLGIENTRHRLNLIYPANHLLTIKETATSYTVSLRIHIHD